MLLGVTIPGDIIGPQRPVAAAAPLGRFPLGRPPRSLPPVVHQVPAASQHTLGCPICPASQARRRPAGKALPGRRVSKPVSTRQEGPFQDRKRPLTCRF